MELTLDYALSDTWCGECLVMGAGDRRVQCGGSSLSGSGLQVSFPGLLPLFTNFTAPLPNWFTGTALLLSHSTFYVMRLPGISNCILYHKYCLAPI